MGANGGRADATAAVTRGALRVLARAGLAALTEAPLPDGRRADLMALGPDGVVWIVEVKSGLADWRADEKWRDYQQWCDYFAIAVDERFPLDTLPREVGVIVADRFGGALVRTAEQSALAPARRKALTLRFARLAAARHMVAEDAALLTL